jgi:hypothetical protein
LLTLLQDVTKPTMYFSRIFVLLMVVPQLALGQMAVTPRASSSDVEAQLLNRAARAELRGYAIQQEMQSLGEAFAKDPGYDWNAKSIMLSKLSASERAKVEAGRTAIFLSIPAIGLGLVGFSILETPVSEKLARFSRYKWVLLGVAVIGVAAFGYGLDGNYRFNERITSKEEAQSNALAYFKSFVMNNALQDDLADYRVSLIAGLFPLSYQQKRSLRDSLVQELHLGNYELDAQILKKTGVLTVEQLTVFEKFQSDTAASLEGASPDVELRPMDVANNTISHLEALQEQLDQRAQMLQGLKILPRMAPGGITAAELHQRHLDWAKEVIRLITHLNDGLTAISNQR